MSQKKSAQTPKLNTLNKSCRVRGSSLFVSLLKNAFPKSLKAHTDYTNVSTKRILRNNRMNTSSQKSNWWVMFNPPDLHWELQTKIASLSKLGLASTEMWYQLLNIPKPRLRRLLVDTHYVYVMTRPWWLLRPQARQTARMRLSIKSHHGAYHMIQSQSVSHFDTIIL